LPYFQSHTLCVMTTEMMFKQHLPCPVHFLSYEHYQHCLGFFCSVLVEITRYVEHNYSQNKTPSTSSKNPRMKYRKIPQIYTFSIKSHHSMYFLYCRLYLIAFYSCEFFIGIFIHYNIIKGFWILPVCN
jgi:hypothetical protein